VTVPREVTTALTRNERAFGVLVRNLMFRHVELAALDRPDELAAVDTGCDASQWTQALDEYFEAHDDIGTGPQARGPAMLMIDKQPAEWIVTQIIDDPSGDHDWRITLTVDLPASDEQGRVIAQVRSFEAM